MPQKENRKIVRIGKTSLGIILPKAWLRYFSINAGDKVEVISNGYVTVKPLNKNNTTSPYASEVSA
jgi:bifunctional DNA-binding transcriptional regulator/antitoxin component of YhaV-PrlF toxin-antitoxin module